jgi:xylulokinase
MRPAVIGFDVGTSSSKGVLVSLDGELIAQHAVEHRVDRPFPAWAEADVASWWTEFVAIVGHLLGEHDVDVRAVGVSGMGPCVAITDCVGAPLRPAILYGVDTRATAQIAELEERYGRDEIMRVGGSRLSTQAVGPKLAWLSEHEPETFARARRLFMPSSHLVFRLTGEYVLDHHSASQCTPMYDVDALAWHEPWARQLAGDITLPPLVWPGDVVGQVSRAAATQTGLPAGVAVIAGTIDAWAEAVSGDAHNDGDLMLMYGTTMFLVNTTDHRISHPSFWGTVGALPGSYSLAGGMATSGAVTDWLRDLCGGVAVPKLLAEADQAGVGAGGLLMLPYFMGERTPIADPNARGVICGLTLSHTRGDLYRAALEATAFGVRHNIEAMRSGGGRIDRIVAVGGGTRGGLWTQIVSDVTGLEQDVPATTVGASYGVAFLAARAIGHADINAWNPIAQKCEPTRAASARYDALYDDYLGLYLATRDMIHRLSGAQEHIASV